MSQDTQHTISASLVPVPSQTPQYNLPSNWDASWNSFTSNWTFPPPFDPKLIKDFRYAKSHINTASTFLTWTVQNSSRPSTGNFGAERSVVHVGDVIEVDWVKANRETPGNAEPRRVKLTCSICGAGQDNGSTAFTSCSNYTENVSSYLNDTLPITPPQSLVLQGLSSVQRLSGDAIGICFMSLSYLDGTDGDDYSRPFAVSNAPRVPRFRFSARYIAGSEDQTTVAQPTPVSTSPASVGSKDKPSVGIIVGAAIAVFVFTCLVVAIIWFVWTRTRGTRAVKRVGTPGTEDEVEMQRVQHGGVQRRLDRDDDGEAPPAYHESLKHEIVTDHDQRRYV